MISLAKLGISAAILSLTLVAFHAQSDAPTFEEVDMAQATELTGGSDCDGWFYVKCDQNERCPMGACYSMEGGPIGIFGRPTAQFYCNGSTEACGIRYQVTGCFSAPIGK